jgi:hypothetical protein
VRNRLLLRLVLACLIVALVLVLATPLFAARHVRVVDDEGGFSLRSLIGTIFAYGFILQIAAILHWTRRRPDTFWIWIIIIGGAIGAIAYFLIEGGPDLRALRTTLKGPGRRRRIGALRLMVRDNPSAGNYEQLGELLMEEKKYAEARDAFSRALASRTDSLDPFYWRGVAAYHLGDYDEAIPDLQHVSKADPKYDYSRVLCLLGQALAKTGRVDEATATFEKLVRSSTSAESACAAAEFYITRGRFEEAHDLIETLLARRPTMPSYQKRRDRLWLRKAKKLERRLRRVEPASEGRAARKTEPVL